MNNGISLTRLFLIFALLGCETKLCQGFMKTNGPARDITVSSVSARRQCRTLFANTVPPHLPMAVDPFFEAEILTDAAHVAMDFSGIVFSPSRSLLRLFTVLGRIFAISADYVVDHSVHTEELAIQLFLICVALKDYLHDLPSSNDTTK